MVTRRPTWLRLTILLAAASAGCTQSVAEMPVSHRGDVAVPSYAGVAGAPPYCARLAGSTALPGIPTAVGLLAGDPGNVEAEVDLTAAIDELRAVLDDVRPALDDAVGELVAALTAARDQGLTEAVRDDISAGLDELGTLVQPACGFPT
ncbi:hypothetical protein FHU33_3886 [Blastococcus colisei]|uniref:Uncharacterized protein n=1 Tax=Blastococcus colisei TaxID=1564162 RepID=A0A543PJX5_9ACTN|nr:conjugal transfer protein TraF [Blastococcus colisei]TQN44384.1 hypothetical protein FHU33_3886 [Blastococcus colisei]